MALNLNVGFSHLAARIIFRLLRAQPFACALGFIIYG
jgi:hypothetical protein